MQKTLTIMATRVANLEATIAGFKETGVPLVQTTASGYAPAGLSDDPGLSLFVPRIASAFGLNAVDAAGGLLMLFVVAAIASGIAGVMATWTSRLGRAAGVAAVLAAAGAMIRVGDVYLVSAALAVGFVPWLYGAAQKNDNRMLLALAPWVGAAAGLGNLIRAHAGTMLLLMYVLAVLLSRGKTVRSVVSSLVLLAITATIPLAVLWNAEKQRDDFLAQRPYVDTNAVPGHPFWHTVYIGLGYVPNPYGLEYRDEIGFATVERLVPGADIGSEQYENALRSEVIRIARQQPLFIARVIGTKLLRIVLFALIFLNVALFALARARPSAEVWLPYAAGLVFSAVPGLLAVPNPGYLLGFMGLCLIAGAAWDDYALSASSAAQRVKPKTGREPLHG